MDKPTKKRNMYNTDILFAIKESTGYSIDYIRKCLRGDRTGIMPDKVKKSYKDLESASIKAINENLPS